jgi:hypothetical protein
MFGQELAVFPCKNVVRHRGDFEAFAQPPAQLQHQRGFPAAHRAADADRERTPVEIAIERQVALVKMTGFVGVPMRVPVAII